MNPMMANKLFLAVLWTLPFYLPLAVWIASHGASIYVLSAWKELLMAVLLLCLLRPLADLMKNSDKTTRLLNGLIGAYIVLCFLYIFRADSLFEFTGGFLFDTRFLFFFLIAQALVVTAKLKPEHIARIVVTMGVVLSVIAIAQVFVLSPQFLVHLGYEPYGVNLRGLPPSVTPLGDINDFIRPQATLRGPNPLGAFLVLPLALLLWQMFQGKKRDIKIPLKLFVITFALGLTFSRSAWIAAGLAMIVLFFGAFGGRLRTLKKLPFILAAVIVCLGLVVVLSSKTGRLIIFREDKNSSISVSDNQRSSLSREALRDVREHPLGHGPGNAGPVSALDQNDTGRIAENYYLQTAQELGWLGLTLFAGITVVLLSKLWQIRRSNLAMVAFATLIGLSIANLTLHTWSDEVVSIFWWSFAGAVIGTAAVQTKDKASPPRKHRS